MRRGIPAVLVIAALLSCAPARQETRPARPPLVDLWGEVIDGNNRPVAGAEVRVGEARFTTGNDGVFHLDALPAGSIEVQASVTGDEKTRKVEAPVGSMRLAPIVLAKATPRIEYRSPELGAAELVPGIGVMSYGSVAADGARVVVEVVADETRGFDIWAIGAEDGRIEELVSTPDFDENPRLSPDGTRVAFHRFDWHAHREELARQDALKEIWVKDLRSGELRKVDGGLTPAWSPDGEWLVYGKYVNRNADIYRAHLATGRIERLTNHGAKDIYPYWGHLAGAEKIVFSSSRADPDKRIYDVWSMDPDGGRQERLTSVGLRTGIRMFGPVISPDGLRVAFWEFSREHGHAVWLMDHDGGRARKILEDAANPNWDPSRPDGTLLYFNSKKGGQSQIWRIALPPADGAIAAAARS